MLTRAPSLGPAAAPHCCSLWSYTKSWLYLLPPAKMAIWQICFFLLPPKYSFCLCSTNLTSLLEVRITTQPVIFGIAVSFFYYFTGTIFLLLFPSPVSSKTPLTIATWNAEGRRGPASHFLLPAVICRDRGAAHLHLLSLWLKHPRVPGLCPDSQGAHKNHLLDNLSIEDTRPECKKVIGSLEQCWLHEVCVICSLTSQDECEGTGSTRPQLTSALRLTLQHWLFSPSWTRKGLTLVRWWGSDLCLLLNAWIISKLLFSLVLRQLGQHVCCHRHFLLGSGIHLSLLVTVLGWQNNRKVFILFLCSLMLCFVGLLFGVFKVRIFPHI